MKLSSDVRVLKKHILPITNILPTVGKYTPLYRHTYPIQYHNRLKWLAEQYNAHYRFDLRDYCYLHYRWHGRIVELIYQKNNPPDSFQELVQTFSHELAHAIQQQVFRYVIPLNRRLRVSFQKELQYERAAERTAYFICKTHFGNKYDWKPQQFTRYKTPTYIRWFRRLLETGEYDTDE